MNSKNLIQQTAFWLKLTFSQNIASKNSAQGFTMIEMVVVMLIISILAAIAAPSWVAMINRTRLSDAEDKVLQYLRITQNEAKQKKTRLQLQIKVGKVTNTPDENNLVLAICRPADPPDPPTPCGSKDIRDKFYIPSLELDTTGNATTMQQVPSSDVKVRYIVFDDRGQISTDNGQIMPARITMQIENGGSMRRCAFVQTTLGAMSTAKDNDCNK